MPERVQMTRNRPWRNEHPDAVIVARPSKWGNPFRITNRMLPGETQPRWMVVDDNDVTYDVWPETQHTALFHAVCLYADLYVGLELDVDEIRAELAGRDLACWCPPLEPCHADILLSIANSEGGERG